MQIQAMPRFSGVKTVVCLTPKDDWKESNAVSANAQNALETALKQTKESHPEAKLAWLKDDELYPNDTFGCILTDDAVGSGQHASLYNKILGLGQQFAPLTSTSTAASKKLNIASEALRAALLDIGLKSTDSKDLQNF